MFILSILGFLTLLVTGAFIGAIIGAFMLPIKVMDSRVTFESVGSLLTNDPDTDQI